MTVLNAIAGPDRVVPVNKIVGLDGSRSTVDNAYWSTLYYHWRIIQVPEGDPHLIPFPANPGDTITGGDGAVILLPVLLTDTFDFVAGSDFITVDVGVDLTDVRAGQYVIVPAGANAGRYKITEVDRIGPTKTIRISVSAPATTTETVWEVRSTETSQLLFPVAGLINTEDIVLVNGYITEIVSVFGGGINVSPPVPLAYESISTLSIISQTILRHDPTSLLLPFRTPFTYFVPSVQGIYIARLIVREPTTGAVSDPSVCTISVAASNVALDLPIDSAWIWQYLADFWSMVRERGWVETGWKAFIRAIGSMLQDLWNVESDASLATAQDVTMSRWAAFDADIVETAPEKTLLETRYRVLYSSSVVPGAPLWFTVNLSIKNKLVPTLVVYNVIGRTPEEIADDLNALVGTYGIKVTLELVNTTYHLAIRSERFGLSITDTAALFGFLSNNTFAGTGQLLSTTTLRLSQDYGALVFPTRYDVDRVIRPGDPINIGGTSYTITAVGKIDGITGYPITYVSFDPPLLGYGDPPSDPLWPPPPPATPPSVPWAIPSFFRSPEVDYGGELVSPGDAMAFIAVHDGTREEIAVQVMAANAYRVGTIDPSLFYDGWTVQLEKVRRRFRIPVDERVLSVPRLKVSSEETKGWVEFMHYIVSTRRNRRCLVFEFYNEKPEGMANTTLPPTSVPVWYPPARYWAEIVYMDRRQNLEDRFGGRLDFYIEDTPEVPGFSYQKALLGLWYCYLYGSKPRNIEKGLSIILGAPFFESDGTILDMYVLDATHALMLVRDKEDKEVVRSYVYPTTLSLAVNPLTGAVYQRGDTVRQFETICDAAVYRDYINDPTFIGGLIAAGFITEPEKYHTFHVGVNSEILPPAARAPLLAAIRFLNAFKTTYNRYFFSIAKLVTTDIEIEEEVAFKASLFLDTYFGARWGLPAWSRAQLSGSKVHSHFGCILTGDEHFRAAFTNNGGTQEVRFYHRNADGSTGTQLDPEKWGILVGNSFTDENWINGPASALQELPVLTVNSDCITLNIAGAGAYPRDAETIDVFAVRGRPWWGFGDAKFYPRDHVRIRVGTDIPGGFVTLDTDASAGPAADPLYPRLPGYPGPEQ